jgi:prevent-host-death family protein
MARQYSIAGARNQLPALVHDAEAGRAVHLTRRGKPVAVLISAADYDRLTRERDPWVALEAFRKSHDLSGLDVGEVFADVRDRSRGRQVKW